MAPDIDSPHLAKAPQKKRRLAFILPIIAIIAGIGIHGALVATKPQAKQRTVTEHEWLVQSEIIQKNNHQPVLLLYGRIESPSLTQLTAAVDADVVAVKVNEGENIKQGVLLVQLDDREARQRSRQRQAELAEIEALIEAETARHANNQTALTLETELLNLVNDAVKRTGRLKSRELASQAQADEAQQTKVRQELALANRRYNIFEHTARLNQLQARREQARARLSLAKLEIERTRIRAPYHGVITKTNIAPGKRVRVGEPLIEIFDPTTLRVRAQIPHQQLAAIRHALDQQQTLRAISQIDGKMIDLVLHRFASTVEARRGGVDALLKISKASHTLQIGRVIEILLTLPNIPQTFTIPREALYGIDQLYKIDNNRLVNMTVNVVGELRTLNGAGRLMVSSQSLQNGDQILVTKFANAIAGLKVNIKPATP